MYLVIVGKYSWVDNLPGVIQSFLNNIQPRYANHNTNPEDKNGDQIACNHIDLSLARNYLNYRPCMYIIKDKGRDK